MSEELSKTILVQKHARFFLSQEPHAGIRKVVFVLHGYGQSAEHFLRKFRPAFKNDVLWVAPEGLHRYYTQGSSGRVGASWMTREAREDDIADYVHFLDQVWSTLKPQIASNCEIEVLGFSQGAATAARWVAFGAVKPARVIFWGGLFPPDMDWERSASTWQDLPVESIIGDADEYYSDEEFRSYYEPLKKYFGVLRSHTFEGGHTITEEGLKMIFA